MAAVLGVLLGLLALAPSAHAEPAPNQPMVCKPWVIVSAYGSDERSIPQGDSSYSPGYEWGSSGVNSWYIAGVQKALHDQHGVDYGDMSVRNLSYPASLAMPFQPGYWDSMHAGRDRLAQEVEWYDTHCGTGTGLVLIGFSQGAHVVKEALAQPSVQAHEDVIAAIVDIADPSRYNGQIGMGQDGQMLTVNPDFSVGSASVSDGGLLARRAVPGVFAGFLGDGRYFDVCRTDDHVCNRPGPPKTDDLLNEFGKSITAHLSYGAGDRGATADRVTRRAVSSAVAHQAERNAPDDSSDTSCKPHGPTDALGAAAVTAACQVIAADTWYTWGGGHSVSPPQATYGFVDRSDPERSKNDPYRKGFDCSGYVRYAFYKAAGYDIIGDRVVSQIFQTPWPVRISADQGWRALHAGDIVFFGTPSNMHHVAIYIGNGLIAEAPQSDEKIRVSPMSSHSDYAGAVRVDGAGAGGGPNSTWGTEVRTHTEPSTTAPVYTTLAGPTALRIDCQKHAQSVTAEGYTNDAWSHLPDLGGSWISNIYVKGPGWLPGIPACDGSTGPGSGDHSTWGTNVRVHATPSVGSDVVHVFTEPAGVRVVCQKHAERVTAEGYTNDAWSFLGDQTGWISNIYLQGPDWLTDVPTCDGGSAVGGGDHMTWGTDVSLHTAPSTDSPRTDLLPGPTAVRIDCQLHAQSVTAEGYTNDAWSHLADRNAWISNIYVQGAAWLDGVPACDGDPGTGTGDNVNYRSTWGTDVRIHQDASSGSPVVATLPGPTQVTAFCQDHGESVTAEGYTNDAWTYLSDYKGWVSNIYVQGAAWLDGVPACDAHQPGEPPNVR
ncbi:NlpC/P60 family protein [Streptomyces griseosporeus]